MVRLNVTRSQSGEGRRDRNVEQGPAYHTELVASAGCLLPASGNAEASGKRIAPSTAEYTRKPECGEAMKPPVRRCVVHVKRVIKKGLLLGKMKERPQEMKALTWD